MEIKDSKSLGSLAPLVRELRQLGLESNIVGLEVLEAERARQPTAQA